MKILVFACWSLQSYSNLKNGRQKRAKCFATLLQNELKSDVTRLTTYIKPVLQQISLLQFDWILSSDWMRLPVSRAIHGSQVTCCKTSLCWACKMRNIYRFCHKKKKPLPTFCNNFSQPASTWFVARQVWFVVGKTRNIVLRIVLQHTLGGP